MGRAGHRTALTAAASAALLSAALLLTGCTASTDQPEPSNSSPAPIASEPGTTSPSATEDSGDGGDDQGDDQDDDTPDPAATATEAATGPPFAANTQPDTAEPTGAGETFLSVTDVRVAAHDGYDRVVFDLDGKGSGKPGWRVEYVDKATDDGSGQSVEVDGDAILRVSLSGTATPTDSGVDEFAGDRIEPADTEAIDEIVYRYWFEGYTTAFIGVDETEHPFRVFLLENPTRVVVDIQH